MRVFATFQRWSLDICQGSLCCLSDVFAIDNLCTLVVVSMIILLLPSSQFCGLSLVFALMVGAPSIAEVLQWVSVVFLHQLAESW